MKKRNEKQVLLEMKKYFEEMHLTSQSILELINKKLRVKSEKT